MSLAADSMRGRIGYLSILGGVTALIDAAWGAIAVLPFDWTLPHEAVLGVSFVIGFPAYLFDFWRKGRLVILMPAVILLRGFAEFYAGSPHTLGWQLRGNELLIAAYLLLQWSKLRNPGASVPGE
jgi:hypothetical protein